MVKKVLRTSTVILLILTVIVSCSACKKERGQNISFCPELVQYKLWRSENSNNEFSFNIEAISSKRNIDIEYISAKGINTENISVTFTDDTFSELNKSIDGKYVTLIGVHCFAVSDYTKINSMKLKIDGENFNISFPTPIENTFFDDSDSKHCLSPLGMPTYVFTTSFVGQNETDYTYAVTATENITITQIKFADFIEFSDAKVSVNGAEIGKIEDALPLKLNKDDELRVFGKIKTTANSGLYMGNIYTDLIFDCETDTLNKITEYYPITAAFIGNRNDAKKFINSYRQ